MKLVGPETLNAYRAEHTSPKGPALDRYMSEGIRLAKHMTIWPEHLFLRDQIRWELKPLLKRQ